MQTEQKKALVVGVLVALVCSILVSVTVVALRPIQDKSKTSERIVQIASATGVEGDPFEVYKKLQPALVDLKTGKMTKIDNPTSWSNKYSRMIKDPAVCDKLTPAEDIAAIKMVPNEMLVYVYYENEKPSRVLMPMYGTGLYSVLHAYLAVDVKELAIVGIKFSEHGETPGLGGEVDNPKWQAKWLGKAVYDANNNVKFNVTKSSPKAGSAEANYAVDAISGATLTSNGVNAMVRFWMGDHGYKTFLMQLHREAI